jgi:two-component system, OmpR family, phosphate regulon sensor histidine kinase PhoR
MTNTATGSPSGAKTVAGPLVDLPPPVVQTRGRLRLRTPATRFLSRARLIFMVTAMIPTVLMTVLGIILLAVGGSESVAVIAGILVLSFCAMALTGYTIGSVFVTRGASLAALQNEFLSLVSHELRTPLTSIRMFIDTLRQDRVRDPEERARCLTVIDQELGRLDGLVGKLIELSKIEHRQAVFNRGVVGISDIVADALAAFEAVKVGGVVDLRVTLEPDLKVYGDRSALAQAVANLLANAWKYTPAEGKRIELMASADAKHVTISVADNGGGIPRHEQNVIFEKFRRGSSAEVGGSAGSGLGLALVRAIVDAHRGKVDVRSDAGHGARFRIILPRHQESP